MMSRRLVCVVSWAIFLSAVACVGLSVPDGSGNGALVASEPAPAVIEAERARIEVIQKAMAAAVSVFEPSGRGGGSGVVISPDGYALSNFHVVQPCGTFIKCGMADGRVYDAVLVGLDPTGDVALIKLFGRADFPTAPMGNSDTVRVGDWCFAVGNPFLLATDLQPTVTFGIVSGVHRYQYPAGTILEYADCIQTDASINPGNSGGPLFNLAGELIGINGRGSFEKRGRVNVGVGYAISINQIKNFLGQLRGGRIVDHATLGATVVTDDQGRVVISNILTSSDAFRRGLRYGDEIVSFAGRPITTVNRFKNVLGTLPKGWRVPLTFQRAGERYDTFVRLAGVHTQEELLRSVERPVAPRQPQPERRPRGEQPPPAPRPDSPPQPMPEQPPSEESDDESPPDAKQVPDEVRACYQARRGFANYYFNLLERQRVWNQFAAHGTFHDLTGDWLITGEAADSNVEVRWDGKYLTGRFPDGPARIDLTGDLADQLQPIGSGGLLPALHLWRQFLVLGPEQFGQVYYYGEAPLPGREGLFDVLVGVHDVIECYFYFDRVSGRMAAMEMFADSASDPCELYFDNYQVVGGREIPRSIQVIYGDQHYADIRVRELKVVPAASPTNTPQENPRGS